MVTSHDTAVYLHKELGQRENSFEIPIEAIYGSLNQLLSTCTDGDGATEL
jgi:hypothetical protein